MSERKSKNVFLVLYVSMVVLLLMMSSCGSGRVFHIGTGQEMFKSDCGGYRIK
tara:strand:- start:243 stop:401 length:159 start_codon:yes stop_codon:yes gene_type:complete